MYLHILGVVFKKEWGQTIEGYNFFSQTKANQTYSWTGGTFGNLIHGDGRLITHNKKGIIVSEIKCQALYGAPNIDFYVDSRYGKYLGKIKEFLSSCNANEVVAKVKNGQMIKLDCDGQEIEIGKDDLLISLVNKEGYSSATNGVVTVILDTTLSKDLLDKGFISEFVSKVQNLRKDSGLNVTDHIKIWLDGDKEDAKLILQNKTSLQKTLLADQIEEGRRGQFNTQLQGQNILTVYIEKV